MLKIIGYSFLYHISLVIMGNFKSTVDSLILPLRLVWSQQVLVLQVVVIVSAQAELRLVELWEVARW